MNGDAATTRQPWSLLALDRAFRACWAADTCSPDDLPDWRPDNPSVGHCDITTLVVNDLFGGDLLVAAVRRAGSPHGYHWWNRLPNGVELDLTLDQFRAGETLSPPRAVTRPPGPPLRRHPEYELLRARLTRQLGLLPSAGGGQAPPGAEGVAVYRRGVEATTACRSTQPAPMADTSTAPTPRTTSCTMPGMRHPRARRPPPVRTAPPPRSHIACAAVRDAPDAAEPPLS
ncbi:YunG family protein [Streptomyces tunisiensis]|uniref:YunG family protein n=1 Tax=Streptomyces tunisiensis TaxID=948699 RepID=UPI003EDEBE6B